MQIQDALDKRGGNDGGLRKADEKKLCSTHNLIPPMKDIDAGTVKAAVMKIDKEGKKKKTGDKDEAK
jgi:hypothetical protein